MSGISGDCDGLFLTARTLDGAGAVLGTGVKQIAGDEVTATYMPSKGVPVSQIVTVSLAIT